MKQLTLTEYRDSLLAFTADFGPCGTDWHNIPMERLEKFMAFLESEKKNFLILLERTLHLNECMKCTLTYIYRSFRGFTTWMSNWMVPISQSLADPIDLEYNKARLTHRIASFIEILLMPILHNYDVIRIDEDVRHEYLDASERKKLKMCKVEEDERSSCIEQMMLCINGSCQEDRDKKYRVLGKVVDGLKGAPLGYFIKAAQRLRWLNDTPKFNHMKQFWGASDPQSSFSNFMSPQNAHKVRPEKLETCMRKLEEEFCKTDS